MRARLRTRGRRLLAALLGGLLLLPLVRAAASPTLPPLPSRAFIEEGLSVVAGRAARATARFQDEQEIAYPIRYSDSYFERPDSGYHQPLALSSLGLALSAFRAKEAPLKDKGRNVAAYLGELGFEQLSLSQYDVDPSQQTIATAIARKAVVVPGQGQVPVIAVAVSGGGYKDEWKSNFAVGSGQHHAGFEQAAQQVVARIKDYLDKQGIQAPYKLWLTGYSRAAATANRSAAILIDGGLVHPDDLYAYTFATPNVTRQSTAQLYPSIYNIVGAFDPVPMIPFSEWGYRRYGQTWYLPSPQTNSDYLDRLQPVRRSYQAITGGSFWVNLSSNEALRKTLSALSQAVPDPGAYTGQFQQWIINLWGLRTNPTGMLGLSLRELWGDQSRRRQVGGMLSDLWTITANAFGEKMMQDSGALQSSWQQGTGLLANLVHEHVPTVYLSWLAAHADLDSMASPSVYYRQVYLSGLGSLRVLDERGETAVDIDFAKADSLQSAGKLPMTMAGDQLVLTLPSDHSYRLRLTPLPDVSVSLTLREGQAGHSRMGGHELAGDPLPKGQDYELSLPAGAPQASYALSWPGGQRALSPTQSNAALTQGEARSQVSTTMRDSLVQVLVLALSLLLQLVFYAALTVRALRHWRRGRWMGLVSAVPAHRYRLLHNPGLRVISATKYVAALLLLTAISLLGLAAYFLYVWYVEIGQVDQPLLRWYTTLYLLPCALMLLDAGVPALAAAIHHLRWRQGLRCLHTGRLFLYPALLFTLVQLVFVSSASGLPQSNLVPALSLLQLALILAELVLGLRCHRREKGLLAAGGVPARGEVA